MALVSGQQMMIILQMRIGNLVGGSGQESRASFAVTGTAGTLTASDSRAILSQSDQREWGSFIHIFTAGSTGTATVTAKYSVSASTGQFFNRILILRKF
jgi:hypothetical protein